MRNKQATNGHAIVSGNAVMLPARAVLFELNQSPPSYSMICDYVFPDIHPSGISISPSVLGDGSYSVYSRTMSAHVAAEDLAAILFGQEG